MDLSVIVVNYRTPTLTITAVKSIYAAVGDLAFEVIVVDNGSGDG